MQATEWDHRLAVRADGKNLIGHAGVVLLRKVADRVGLTTALSAALPKGAGPGWRDRGWRWSSWPARSYSARRTSWKPSNSSTTGARCSRGRSRTAPCARLGRDRRAGRGAGGARPRRDPPSGVDAARPAARRLPLDRGVRPGADRLVRPRPRRDHRHLHQPEGRRGGHLQRQLRPHAAGSVGGQHLRVRRHAAAARQRATQRRRRPQDGPGRRAAATPTAAVVEAADPDRRRGLQPRRPRPSPAVVHQPAPGPLGDRLGHQRNGRAGRRAAARAGVGHRAAAGRRGPRVQGTRRRMDLLPGCRADRGP